VKANVNAANWRLSVSEIEEIETLLSREAGNAVT